MARSSIKNKEKKKSSRKPKEIRDIKQTKESREISFKEKKWRVEFSKKDIKHFFKKNKFRLIYILSAVVFSFGIFGYFFIGRADIVDFYPSSCLGGWENPQNAQGKPDLSENASDAEFNESNSAVLRNVISQIFCGSFKGDILENSTPSKISLKLRLAAKTEGIKTIIPLIETTSSPPIILPETPAASSSENIDSASSTSFIEKSFLSKIISSVFAEEINPESTNSTTQAISEPINAPVQASPTETSTPVEVLPAAESTTPSIDNQNSAPSETSIIINKEPINQPENSLTTQNSTSTTETSSSTPTTTEEIIPISATNAPDPFLEIFYSLDGSNWKSLGGINSENWKNLNFDIPISSWDEIRNLQINIRSLSPVDLIPVVYIDGMLLEVEYKTSLFPEFPDPLPQPDFSKDVIIYEKQSDGVRAVKIERPNNQNPEIWFSISTSTDQSSKDISWGKVNADEIIDYDSPIDLKFDTIFWMNKENRAIWSFNINTGGYN
ncbi:hypothetical protein HY227_00925 [Candidatus Wolfebacteria bacterium]|nr:hypothetical protein [Candidatus Wolfebacteria bacterium]